LAQESTINRSDFIENLASEGDLSIKQADKLVSIVFLEMSEALGKGERVEIRGFGSFKLKRYDAYEGRNPESLKTIEIRPKKVPFSKCGLELNRWVNSKLAGARAGIGGPLKSDRPVGRLHTNHSNIGRGAKRISDFIQQMQY
jgi:integration host factor subunit beta